MDAPLRDVRAGLDLLLPRKNLFLDLTAGWSSRTGPVARGELGGRLGEHVGVFGYGQWTPAETVAGVGVRLTR